MTEGKDDSSSGHQDFLFVVNYGECAVVKCRSTEGSRELERNVKLFHRGKDWAVWATSEKIYYTKRDQYGCKYEAACEIDCGELEDRKPWEPQYVLEFMVEEEGQQNNVVLIEFGPTDKEQSSLYQIERIVDADGTVTEALKLKKYTSKDPYEGAWKACQNRQTDTIPEFKDAYFSEIKQLIEMGHMSIPYKKLYDIILECEAYLSIFGKLESSRNFVKELKRLRDVKDIREWRDDREHIYFLKLCCESWFFSKYVLSEFLVPLNPKKDESGIKFMEEVRKRLLVRNAHEDPLILSMFTRNPLTFNLTAFEHLLLENKDSMNIEALEKKLCALMYFKELERVKELAMKYGFYRLFVHLEIKYFGCNWENVVDWKITYDSKEVNRSGNHHNPSFDRLVRKYKVYLSFLNNLVQICSREKTMKECDSDDLKAFEVYLQKREYANDKEYDKCIVEEDFGIGKVDRATVRTRICNNIQNLVDTPPEVGNDAWKKLHNNPEIAWIIMKIIRFCLDNQDWKATFKDLCEKFGFIENEKDKEKKEESNSDVLRNHIKRILLDFAFEKDGNVEFLMNDEELKKLFSNFCDVRFITFQESRRNQRRFKQLIKGPGQTQVVAVHDNIQEILRKRLGDRLEKLRKDAKDSWSKYFEHEWEIIKKKLSSDTQGKGEVMYLTIKKFLDMCVIKDDTNGDMKTKEFDFELKSEPSACEAYLKFRAKQEGEDRDRKISEFLGVARKTKEGDVIFTDTIIRRVCMSRDTKMFDPLIDHVFTMDKPDEVIDLICDHLNDHLGQLSRPNDESLGNEDQRLATKERKEKESTRVAHILTVAKEKIVEYMSKKSDVRVMEVSQMCKQIMKKFETHVVASPNENDQVIIGHFIDFAKTCITTITTRKALSSIIRMLSDWMCKVKDRTKETPEAGEKKCDNIKNGLICIYNFLESKHSYNRLVSNMIKEENRERQRRRIRQKVEPVVVVVKDNVCVLCHRNIDSELCKSVFFWCRHKVHETCFNHYIRKQGRSTRVCPVCPAPKYGDCDSDSDEDENEVTDVMRDFFEEKLALAHIPTETELSLSEQLNLPVQLELVLTEKKPGMSMNVLNEFFDAEDSYEQHTATISEPNVTFSEYFDHVFN